MRWLLLTLFVSTQLLAETFDVVIIGAGVSGTYTGWRLVEGGKKDVHIFEGSDRIGGRIYTTRLPGMDNVPVELGAMRFHPSHKRLDALVKYLKLETAPFTQENENNFIYVRGKRFREKDEKELPYSLPAGEEGHDPYALVIGLLGKIDVNLSTDNWAKRKKTARYKGQSLYDVSWQNFLLENLSSEAFQMLVDLGYVQMVADVSVASAFSNFIEGASGAPLKFVHGYQLLPDTLANNFQQKGGKLHLNHHLMSVSYEGEKETFRYRLLFYDQEGAFKPVYAKHLILTITPPALKLLAQQSPALQNNDFREKLDLFTPNPLTKLYLGYRYPWWQKLGLQSGSSVTTLPIRSCYYFGSEAEAPGGEPDNNNSLILASFQGLYTPFWQSFNEGAEFAPNLGKDAAWQAEKQLEILHGVHNMPSAYTGTFVDWSDPPHFGAYFFWRVGAHPQEVIEYMLHPFVAEPLYVIGSAYSQHQGWVEGCLETSDALLDKYFFIPPPKW